MKIIDKTPFQNDTGQIDLWGRIQGTLKYGPNWYAETMAQRPVVAQLDRLLEKGFVLIRNFTLPGSEVMVPLILVGPQGVSVLYVTHIKGFYEAKGDQWNRMEGGRSLPAPVNLLNRVVRLARATQVYLDRQRITLITIVEPVLIGADPGLHIESLRPVARVVMSDAIKQYASGLLQGRPTLSATQVYDTAERIVTPRKPDEEWQAEPFPIPASREEPPAANPWDVQVPASTGEGPSRARAIFDAAQSAPAFDPSDLGFALEDEGELDTHLSPPGIPPGPSETGPVRKLPAAQAAVEPPAAKPASRRVLGMQANQLGCLGIMLLAELCILAVAGYYIFFANP